MTDDVALMSAQELIRRYRSRELSPVEAVRAALDRIACHDGTYNAFVLVDEDAALAAALAAEDRWQRGEPIGLVDGVPTGIKDMFLTKGWPTRRGSLTIRRTARGTRIRRWWRGCVSMAPCSSVRRRSRNSAGRG